MIRTCQPQEQRTRANVCALVIIVAGFGLLVSGLGGKSLWGDEEYTTWVIQGDFSWVTTTVMAPGSAHPPLHFLTLWIWRLFAGDTELALRFPSVVFGTLSIAMLYPLGKRMMGQGVGLVATALMAVSPFLVLYSRMARYYSMVLFWTLLSCWFFYSLLTGRGTVRRWMGYTIASALAVYTFYPAAFMVAAQLVVGLAAKWSDRRFLLRLLASDVSVALLFSPWVPVITSQGAVLRALPDAFAGSSSAMWMLSLAYPVLSWTVGETIYPWNPVALTGVILAAYLVSRGFVLAVKSIDRSAPVEQSSDNLLGGAHALKLHLSARMGAQSRRPPQALCIALFIVVPLFLTIVTVRQFVSGASFMGVANRTLFCAPFVYLLIGAGICAVTHPARRFLAVATLGGVLGLSLGNYQLGREFHNPIYSLQIEALADSIAQQAEPGDVFVSDHMTAFDYYIRRNHGGVAFRADEPQTARDYIREHRSPRVWLVLLSRAVDTESLASAELIPWLDEGYELDLTFGYAPLDDGYRRVQQLVLRKPAGEYKVVVSRYRRIGAGSSG